MANVSSYCTQRELDALREAGYVILKQARNIAPGHVIYTEVLVSTSSITDLLTPPLCHVCLTLMTEPQVEEIGGFIVRHWKCPSEKCSYTYASTETLLPDPDNKETS